MNQLHLNKFQDFVATHYFDCNLNIKKICSNIYCSERTLRRTLASYNNCSIIEHVECLRILKSIEHIYYYKEKKVYFKVGLIPSMKLGHFCWKNITNILFLNCLIFTWVIEKSPFLGKGYEWRVQRYELIVRIF